MSMNWIDSISSHHRPMIQLINTDVGDWFVFASSVNAPSNINRRISTSRAGTDQFVDAEGNVHVINEDKETLGVFLVTFDCSNLRYSEDK